MQDDLTSDFCCKKYFPSAPLSLLQCDYPVKGTGCGYSAQVDTGAGTCCPIDSKARKWKRRELRESVARYEILNCPLFHPTVGMEMAHACQGGLGGMTSKLTDVIGYGVKPALRRWPTCFFFSAGKRQMYWASFGQTSVSWVSAAAVRRWCCCRYWYCSTVTCAGRRAVTYSLIMVSFRWSIHTF